jgi:MSHA biogenesis protein MshL
MGLVAGTNYNMVVNPNVTGTISMNLKNVTIQETMEAVRDIYKYDYHRTSYGYEVMQPQLESQVFHLNYLDVQRSGRSYMQLTTGQVSNSIGTVTSGGTGSNNNNMQQPFGNNQPGQNANNGQGTISSVETTSQMRFWKDMQKAVESLIDKGDGHSVTVNQQAGVIVVRAYPGELRRVSRYINSLQISLNRQVILEAKILEVALDDTYQAGIDWAVLGNPAQIDPATGLPSTDAGIGQNSNQIFADTDLKTLNGIFAIRINGNFKTLINLLQAQGNVQVLSSPHISTVNNQKAVIKVGTDEFYVTSVSTSNTIIGTNTLPSQDVSLTPFFSGITLDVTPEISGDNSVILHIHPSVSKVVEQTKVIGLGTSSTGQANNLTLPLAKSTIRESDNIVRAKNGQVIVIGGLMQNNMAETIAATPWLGNIPFIGAAFRRTQQVSNKSELVILLRPLIATNQNFINRMEEEKKQFQVLRRPFHAGSMPKVFGNEAERDPNGY